MPRRTLTSLAVTLALSGAHALAQGPSADWRTVATAHFRVHYTAPAEAWALRAAARLESVRDRVIAEVGYAPPQPVDVVVSDPVAQPNGMALPLLGSPRLVLWTNPPGPASVIGADTDWIELLTVHEETHLVHLLRPSRDPVQRAAELLLPLGPITLKAPRWVHEGYATLVEGRLTGSGRPNGDARAVILRQRARAGRLPSYARMASDSQSWLGMSMAYLAGSAYLEWLAERGGPDALKHLWARLTAATDRGFDEAFEGVFGEPPAKLYERFCAELTWRAVEAERRLGPTAVEGETWQKLTWTVSEPALSRDGTKLAIVLRDREKPSRLVVWSTAPDTEAEKKWKERVDRDLARDPQDVAPERAHPLSRTPVAELVTRDGREPFSPRFMPDGRAVLFVRFETDREGFLHPDVFLWDTASGSVRRVSRLADVREADPSPDGSWAVAVRNRHGLSQLVRVDLASGAVSDLTAPSVEVACAQPRVSPDGSRVVYVRPERGAWKAVVRELAGGRETVLATPDGASVASPAWSGDGRTVFAALGAGGFIDVAAIPAGGDGPPVPVTRTVGAALAPAPATDGSAIYFLALHADGLDVRRVDPRAPAPTAPRPDTADLAPAVPPPPPAHVPVETVAAVGPGRPYGAGRQEASVVLGGAIAPSARIWEAGARLGDVVGRLDAVALAGLGDESGPRGGALAATWRGWPVVLGVHLFGTRERPSEQPDEAPGLGEARDLDRSGGEIAASWATRWGFGALDLAGGALLATVEPVTGETVTERVGFARAEVTMTPSRGRLRVPHSLSVHLESGRTGDGTWRRYGGRLEVGAVYRGTGILVAYGRDTARDAVHAFDRLQLGGVESSLLPASAQAGRIAVPALPAGTLIGDDHEGERATLLLGGLPLFFERHRVWESGNGRGEWLRIAGVEWDLTGDPVPLVKLPGFHLTVGVARTLDEPLKDRMSGWLALGWRP